MRVGQECGFTPCRHAYRPLGITRQRCLALDQNTVQGRVRAKMAKFGKNRVFHHFGCIGFFVVGHAEVVCTIVAVSVCVRFCLDCAMHMHLVMLAVVPKCFCLFAQWSIECLLETDEDAKVPEGTLGKEHGRGSPTSPDLIGFSEECSHGFVENKLRWGLQIIRIEFVMAQSTQSSIS